MEKRGQVTIFVVIGLLILIVIGVVFFIISARNRVAQSEITSTSIDDVRKQVNLDVKLCFENTVEVGIVDGARHGGDVILMNKLNTNNIGSSGLQNPCPMIPTATQEIKLVYGPDIRYDQGGNCNVYDQSGNVINEINSNTVFSFKSNIPDINNLVDSLKNYVREKLPVCLKGFSDYKSKGWRITSTNDDQITDLKDFLIAQDSIDILPPVGMNCPLDDKFVASLKMPIKFSRSKFNGEESFVLDNQEFVYNVNLKYFFSKSYELLNNFLSLSLFNPNEQLSQLPSSGLCTSCVRVESEIEKFKNEIETTCANNGCHLYRATDPNTGAYFFNIKCGEYFMGTGDKKTVNGKTVELKSGNDNGINIDVDGNSGTINKDSTVNVGGIDITYDKFDPASNKATLIIGKSASYLWGYYFGCSVQNMCYIECPSATAPSNNRNC